MTLPIEQLKTPLCSDNTNLTFHFSVSYYQSIQAKFPNGLGLGFPSSKTVIDSFSLRVYEVDS